jgi:membrane-associated phospholipid phosphatase
MMFGLLAAVALSVVSLPDQASATQPLVEAPAPHDAASPVSSGDQTTLKVDWLIDGSIAGAAVAAWVLPEVFKNSWAPAACRWCSAPGIDTSVRQAVVWSNTATARLTSDILVGAVPVGLTLWDFFTANAKGGVRTASEDLLVITEAMAIGGALSSITHLTTARERPYAYYGGGSGVRGDHLSFFSGHTTTVFAVAAATGYVAQTRGYDSWPWFYAVGFTGAATMAYFRMAGDDHWFSDILVGAAVGTGVGLLVPWLHRRHTALSLRVVPFPDGLGLAGRF